MCAPRPRCAAPRAVRASSSLPLGGWSCTRLPVSEATLLVAQLRGDPYYSDKDGCTDGAYTKARPGTTGIGIRWQSVAVPIAARPTVRSGKIIIVCCLARINNEWMAPVAWGQRAADAFMPGSAHRLPHPHRPQRPATHRQTSPAVAGSRGWGAPPVSRAAPPLSPRRR